MGKPQPRWLRRVGKMKKLGYFLISLMLISTPLFGASISSTSGSNKIGTITADKWCVANASGTALDCTTAAPAGSGDVTGPASSVDSEVALFSGTGGKTIKRASGTGIASLVSGVLSVLSKISSSEINWTDVKNMELQTAGINWASVKNAEIQAAGINWTDVNSSQIQSAGINWASTTALTTGGDVKANGVALGTQTTGNYVASVSTTSPITGGVAGAEGTTPTIAIGDAAADGSTKGAAAFNASDFNAASGVISLDYTNGQAADGTHKGFLTSTDWGTFNGKQDAVTAGRSLTFTGATIDADAELYADSKNTYIDNPTTSDSNKVQLKFPTAVTITRVSCSTDTGTATIQFDERAEATPNTAGTNVMTSSLVCDSDSQATTSFSNATIAAEVPMNLQITATASSPTMLRIHVEYTKDD